MRTNPTVPGAREELQVLAGALRRANNGRLQVLLLFIFLFVHFFLGQREPQNELDIVEYPKPTSLLLKVMRL